MIADERLKLIRYLMDSDVAYDADCLALDIAQNRPVTQREKDYAELLGRIYIAIHPTSDCQNPHKEWEAQNEEDLKLAD